MSIAALQTESRTSPKANQGATRKDNRWLVRSYDRLEATLDKERDRVGLWLPVAFGVGIALWFWLDSPTYWVGALLLCGAVALGGVVLRTRQRIGRIALVAGAVAAAGLVHIWLRAEHLSAPILAAPTVTEFSGWVQKTEALQARGKLRLYIAPVDRPDLPALVRVTIRDDYDETTAIPAVAAPEAAQTAQTAQGTAQIGKGSAQVRRRPLAGDAIALRARLTPPPAPMFPDGYDFRQRAWFEQIGAVGSVLGEPRLAPRPESAEAAPTIRDRLSRHIQQQVAGSAGGIAATLATGHRGGIAAEDARAMRRSSLAHLLSISGLHVATMVGGSLWLLMRILAAFPAFALRWSVPIIASGGAAIAGIGYTLLTGAQVPTVRACIAALLILVALAMGRDVLSLRLVATGALLVMLIWPETMVAPSFQMSFAAVTAIIALYESATLQRWRERWAEDRAYRLLRIPIGLFLTGIAVEFALIPIALFHFHESGIYGALANVLAIPLTSFVIMPAEFAALLFDIVGAGAVFWWIVEQSIGLLLSLAHWVADSPGAVATIPQFSPLAFATILLGGLWFVIWRTRWRWWGLLPVAIGALAMFLAPQPDLLISADGRHVATRLPSGDYALLRTRTGRFARDRIAESAGIDDSGEAMTNLEDLRGVECNADLCRWSVGGSAIDSLPSESTAHESTATTSTATIGEGGWKILATRSPYYVEMESFVTACRSVDIVISDRYLPRRCRGQWLTIDRRFLQKTGGLSFYLDGESSASARYKTSREPKRKHPWRTPPRLKPSTNHDSPRTQLSKTPLEAKP